MIDAVHDDMLASAGDDYEDSIEALRRLNEAMGGCAVRGQWTSFYLLLADVKNLRSDEPKGDNDNESV